MRYLRIGIVIETEGRIEITRVGGKGNRSLMGT